MIKICPTKPITLEPTFPRPLSISRRNHSNLVCSNSSSEKSPAFQILLFHSRSFSCVMCIPHWPFQASSCQTPNTYSLSLVCSHTQHRVRSVIHAVNIYLMFTMCQTLFQALGKQMNKTPPSWNLHSSGGAGNKQICSDDKCYLEGIINRKECRGEGMIQGGDTGRATVLDETVKEDLFNKGDMSAEN